MKNNLFCIWSNSVSLLYIVLQRYFPCLRSAELKLGSGKAGSHSNLPSAVPRKPRSDFYSRFSGSILRTSGTIFAFNLNGSFRAIKMHAFWSREKPSFYLLPLGATAGVDFLRAVSGDSPCRHLHFNYFRSDAPQKWWHKFRERDNFFFRPRNLLQSTERLYTLTFAGYYLLFISSGPF